MLVDGIRVRSRCNGNNDGIDIDCCHRVRIANCDISSGDDAIVLKSTAARPCRDVAVTNCVLTTACNCFKLGTESTGGFKDITIANCVVTSPREKEVTYGLTSLPQTVADPAALEHFWRGHWTIENRLHWVRDVTFDEDRSQVRRGAGPQVMATFYDALGRVIGTRQPDEQHDADLP